MGDEKSGGFNGGGNIYPGPVGGAVMVGQLLRVSCFKLHILLTTQNEQDFSKHQ